MFPKMQLITSEEWVASATGRFRDNFRNKKSGEWYKGDTFDSEMLYKRLINTYHLDKSKIEEILGVDKWTVLECGVCYEDVPAVINFSLNESHGNICLQCAERTYDMLIEHEMKDWDLGDEPLDGHPKIFRDEDGNSE